MIKFENTEVVGWEAAIGGMRNPMNSWEKSDSYELGVDPIPDKIDNVKCTFHIGPNDHNLMMRLRNAGTDHRKFMRMITVYVDITAPLYWWAEFDTYWVGIVTTPCSTMQKILEKEFTWDDFSYEHLIDEEIKSDTIEYNPSDLWFEYSMLNTIVHLNSARELYLKTKDKKYWWQMIQLLPSSYNQRRTVMLHYEVLANMYRSLKNHKLDECVEFCRWIKTDLPYSELITGNGSGTCEQELIEETDMAIKKESEEYKNDKSDQLWSQIVEYNGLFGKLRSNGEQPNEDLLREYHEIVDQWIKELGKEEKSADTATVRNIPSRGDWIWERIDILRKAVDVTGYDDEQAQIRLLDELTGLLEDQLEQYEEILSELRR